jgi:hypothetical protein
MPKKTSRFILKVAFLKHEMVKSEMQSLNTRKLTGIKMILKKS